MGRAVVRAGAGENNALRQFDVVIEMEQGSTGAAVWSPITVDDLRDLPQGVFLVDRARETVEAYVAQVDREFPCESSG